MEVAAVVAGQESEERAFEFTAGLLGFPGIRRFVVSPVPGGGEIFRQMLALEQPEVGFTLVLPSAFFADYDPDIPDEEIREIGATGPDQVVLMAIACIPTGVKDATVNLRAPLIFNPYTRQGRQVILSDDGPGTRERLFRT